MRQTVKFEPNQPQTVALEYPEGVNVSGHYGPQTRFYLTENRVMYLDPEPAEALRALKVQPGEPFTITKRTEKGKRQWWDLERLEPAKTPGGTDSPSSKPKHESSPVSASGPQSLTPEPKRIPPQNAQSIPPTAPPPRGLQLTRTPPVKPTYAEALQYCVETVQRVLQDTGEQWSDQSRQAMVSTMMIQLGREGMMRFPIEARERVA